MVEPNPVAYPTDEQNYIIAWKFMPEEWSSEFSDYSGKCSLPIFIGADDWVEYMKTGSFGVEPLFMCIGILYSWTDAPEKWFFGSDDDLDEYRKEILTYYRTRTNAKDMEELIISSAAWVRWNCGCNPSQRVLGGGMLVYPESPIISFDYLLDTWSLLERIPDIDIVGATKSIVTVGMSINIEKLAASSEQGPQQVNTLYYTVLASLLLDGQKDMYLDLFQKWIESGSHAPSMQERVQAAARKTHPTIDDLRLLTKGPS